MPRGNAPIAPQQVGQRPMPQAVPPMQPVSEERSSAVLMASNVLFYSGLATLAAGAGMALRRSGAATMETELTQDAGPLQLPPARAAGPRMEVVESNRADFTC